MSRLLPLGQGIDLFVLSDGNGNIRRYYIQPESTATTANMALVVGTKQSLPTGGLRLIKITRNMSDASGGASGKRAIRIVDRDILDSQEPNWHDPTVSGDAAHTTTVKHYIFECWLKFYSDFMFLGPGEVRIV